jgi:hypothetical protein
MGIIIGGNTLSGTNFNSLGETSSTPNLVTDGLIMWLDAGNFSSYINSNNYYDCGYGCQYYESNPGCTNCNTQIKDMSGNGADGILTNGASIVYTSSGGGINFDGTNDSVEVTKDFGILSNYTICFWARRDAENRMPIAGRTSTAYYWYGDNSWFYTHGGVSGEYYYSKPTSIPAGTWGHYCVVYNGSNVTIYRQGVYQGQQNTTGTANWSQGMKIGYWSSGGGYAYQGIISVVNFYETALSASQILQNFNNGRQRFGI